MKLAPSTLDFETEPIDFKRPHLPPRPVGLAYSGAALGTRKPRYLHWRRPDGTTDTRKWNEGRTLLATAYRQAHDPRHPLLFHHAQFDLDVAEYWFEQPWPAWEQIECTRLLAFMANPYAHNLSLKPLGETVLHRPPDAQTELYAWIKANIPEAKRLRSKKGLGAFIGLAPEPILTRYACEDITLTAQLFEHYAPVREVQASPYELELRTIVVARNMTRRGVPVDERALQRASRVIPEVVEGIEAQLVRALGWLNTDAKRAQLQTRDAVADALEAEGWVAEWVLTKKDKKRSLAYEDLQRTLQGQTKNECKRIGAWLDLWHQRAVLRWQLNNIVTPWLDRSIDGRVHPSWNTTRHEEVGARTARLSSSPNFQNVGKEVPLGDPRFDPRSWIAAPQGEQLAIGDLAQQEPRITAHNAGGRMLQTFIDRPDTDDHQAVSQLLTVERPTGKQLNLAITYALGMLELARRLGRTVQDARHLRARYYAIRPEVKALDDSCRKQWQLGRAILTWAGAEIYVEPTPDDPGRWSYRALNNLIQRSAAEQLKAAMIDAEERGLPLVLSVHDELGACAKRSEAKDVAHELEECLTGTQWFAPWRVPFLADVKIGRTWRACK